MTEADKKFDVERLVPWQEGYDSALADMQTGSVTVNPYRLSGDPTDFAWDDWEDGYAGANELSDLPR